MMPDQVFAEDAPTPAIAKLRSRRGQYRVCTKPQTIPPDPLTMPEKAFAALLPYPDDVERPQTRGKCHSGERPCPFVSCKYHLYLDVNPLSGTIKINFPHLEVWEMSETCALDVADRGGITLEEVAERMGLTRERVRQLEIRCLQSVRKVLPP